MKKITFKERLNNATEAFFANETNNENNSLVVLESQQIAQANVFAQAEEKADMIWDLAKKIFVFAPGVLLLHTFIGAAMTFGLNINAIFYLLAGSFMVWAGLGDLRNKSHFGLPTSVLALGFLFAVPFSFLSLNLTEYYIYFYIGLLPLFFITPILTKSYLDKTLEESSQK